MSKTLTLEVARHMYDSDDKVLMAAALQWYSKDELEPYGYIYNIHSYEDALRHLGREVKMNIVSDYTKLMTIVEALNNSENIDMTHGNVYAPNILFTPDNLYNIDEDDIIIGWTNLDGTKYIIHAFSDYKACGTLNANCRIGKVDLTRVLLGCKSKEICDYLVKEFGKLIIRTFFPKCDFV